MDNNITTIPPQANINFFESVLQFISSYYSFIAITIAIFITLSFMVYKKSMESSKAIQVALSSITLFPPMVLMLSVFEPKLLNILSQDKTILFISGFALTLHVINDIKTQFSS